MVTRVEKFGSIFSRASGLLRAGAVKWENRPLWYDCYVAFPPAVEPKFDRLPLLEEPLPELFYPEDAVRARFYKEFGSLGVIDLTDNKYKSVSQRY